MTQFDAYEKTYQVEVSKSIAFAGKEHDFFVRAKAERIAAFAECHLGAHYRESRILDIGCGPGLTAQILARTFPNLCGADISASQIAEARQRCASVDFQSYDPGHLPFKTASFDLSYTVCVMHHVSPNEWVGFLKEARRVTRSGGYVLVFEHNPFNPLTRKAVRDCPFDADAVLLSRRKTRDLMIEAGITPMGGDYILFLPFAGRFTTYFEKSIGWCPLGAQYYVAGRV